MRTLPRPAQLFVIAVVLSGAALFGVAFREASFEQLPLLAALLVASTAFASLKLRLPMTKHRSTLSASGAIDFTSLLLLGPHLTMFVTAAGAWSQSTFRTRRPNPLHRKLFNIATAGLTVQAAGLAYRLAGGRFGQIAWPDAATPVLFASIVYFVVNAGTVAIAVALSTRQSIVQVWVRDFIWGAPSYFVAAGTAALVAVIVDRSLYSLLPLAAVPVYLTYRAYVVYARRLEDERRHREIIESLNEGMFVVNYDGNVELWNEALERITGVGRKQVLRRELFGAVPALLHTALPQAVEASLQGGPPTILPHLEFAAGGGSRILYVRLFPFAAGLTGFVSDITDRTLAEEALRRSEERHALALAGSNDGIWDWDLVNDAMFVSARWKSMLGLPADEVTTSPDEWFGRVHPDDIVPLRAAIDEHCGHQAGHFEYEHRVRHADGAYRWMLCRGVAVASAHGGASRMAGSLTDVTERRAIQDHLRHAALHDRLTGLPNRGFFMELLEQALARSKRPGGRAFAALFIDVDHFKEVNDTLGHFAGDQLLIEISRRLQTCHRRGDVFARLAGDEFTLLLNDVREPAEVVHTAARVRDAFATPFKLDEQEVYVTASIGMALSSNGYAKAEEILRDADTAMYRAKTLGRNRHELFDVVLRAAAQDELAFEVGRTSPVVPTIRR